MLDGSGAGANEYNQYFPTPDFPPSEDFTVPMRPHLSSGQPSTDSSSSAPTDAHMQSGVNLPAWTPANQGHTRQLRVPSAYGSSFEPPGLSSGSSTTPDTKNSQAVTPKNRRGSRNVSIQPKADAVFPPPLPSGPILPPRRRRPRKPKPKPQLSTEEEEAKKNKTLERNRVAASKCREKKKDWTKDLEETKIGLESQNSHLQMEYSTLVKEVGEIRAQLMTHASCHDANIDKWIENEAKKFVLGAGERYDTMLGATPGPYSSNLNSAQGSMPVSAYGASGNDIHFDPSEYRTSLPQRENAVISSSAAFFQDSISSAGFQANPNDDFANHMMQRTSASTPHIAVNQDSPDFLGGASDDPGGEYIADADFSYGAFQAAQEEAPDDENGLDFPHGTI
ncbi:bZIP transcription factor [Apiospora sp. TS-2023a]